MLMEFVRTASLLTDFINYAEKVCRSSSCLHYSSRPLSLTEPSHLVIVGVFQFVHLGQLANNVAILPNDNETSVNNEIL